MNIDFFKSAWQLYTKNKSSRGQNKYEWQLFQEPYLQNNMNAWKSRSRLIAPTPSPLSIILKLANCRYHLWIICDVLSESDASLLVGAVFSLFLHYEKLSLPMSQGNITRKFSVFPYINDKCQSSEKKEQELFSFSLSIFQ